MKRAEYKHGEQKADLFDPDPRHVVYGATPNQQKACLRVLARQFRNDPDQFWDVAAMLGVLGTNVRREPALRAGAVLPNETLVEWLIRRQSLISERLPEYRSADTFRMALDSARDERPDFFSEES